jgi:hypothetical protein
MAAPTPAWADLSALLERSPEVDVANVYKRHLSCCLGAGIVQTSTVEFDDLEKAQQGHGYDCWHAPQMPS